MKETIIFRSGTDFCTGWLYLQEEHLEENSKGQSNPRPAIAMAHGLSATKEMFDLPAFASRFAEAGFVVLLFDYRYWGESEGTPRGLLYPQFQIEDYRNALCYLSLRDEVDENRMGIWGTSLSGGHVLHLGAFDSRVKCVVSQVPAVDLYTTFKESLSTEAFLAIEAVVRTEQIERFIDAPIRKIAVYAPVGEPCLIAGKAAYERSQREATLLTNFDREITLSSIEKIIEYNPGGSVAHISPCPLLMIVAENDEVTPVSLAQTCYDNAKQPKQIIKLPCKHYDVYKRENPKYFEMAATAATEWFSKNL